MATKKPAVKPKSKSRTAEKKESVKASDWLSFSSAIIAVIASGIFYFAGWVYISHWYSFFGIDATELNVSPQTIVIHGVPGVLVIILVGLFTSSIYAIAKLSARKKSVTTEDIPSVIMSIYSVSIFMLLFLIYISNQSFINEKFPENFFFIFSVLPLEVKASIVGVIVLGLFFSLTEQALTKGVTIRIGRMEVGFYPRINYIRDFLWLGMLREQLFKGNFVDFLVFAFSRRQYKSELDRREDNFWNTASKQQLRIRTAASQTWQFWVGAFIILYFLVSISVSSILGEWDAKAGKKSMIGGWQAEATYIYSNAETVLALPLEKAKTTDKLNVYGPLLVLGKNEDTYYFTDWVYKFPYTEKPNVYVVKITENTSLGLQMIANTPTPTTTPFVLATRTPTPKLTATVTPTP